MVWGFAGAIAGMLLYATASLAQGYAARGATGFDVLRSPLYLAGLVADGLAWLCSLVALAVLPLFVVQSLLADSLAVTVLAAAPVLKIVPTRRDLVAVGVTTLGLVLVSAAAGAESEQPPPAGFSPALWIGLGIVVVASAVAYLRAGSVVQGVLAGLAYSVAALGARAAHLGTESLGATLRQPLLWAVVAAGVVGAVMYARALERGEVGPATAGLWVVEVVVPGIVGVAVLRDLVREGWAVPALAGVALAVAGCGVLAHSPAQG